MIYQFTLKAATRREALAILARLTPDTVFHYDASFDGFAAVIDKTEVRMFPLTTDKEKYDQKRKR